MKKIYLLCLAVLFTTVGCTKTDIEPTTEPDKTLAPISFNNEMLKFSSKEAMQDTIYKLADLSYEDREAWYSQTFTSLEKARNKVTKQFESVRTKKEAMSLREMYRNLFVFNYDIVEEDYYPYMPTNEFCYPWVANAYGNVMIDNAVVNLNDVTKYEDTWIAQGMKEHVNIALTKSQENGTSGGTNFVHSWTKDRKMWVHAHLEGNRIMFRFGAHKRIMGNWWNSYSNPFRLSRAPNDPITSNLAVIDRYSNVLKGETVYTEEFRDGRVDQFGIKGNTGQNARIALRIYSNGVGASNAGILRVSL